jgi:hypothetical protein
MLPVQIVVLRYIVVSIAETIICTTVQTDLQDTHAKNKNKKYPNEKAPFQGLFLWDKNRSENEVHNEKRSEVLQEVIHIFCLLYAFLYSLTNVYTKTDILTMYPTAIG